MLSSCHLEPLYLCLFMTQKRNRQAVQIGWGRDWCLCDPIFTGDGGETRKIRTEWLLKDSGEAEVHLFIISLFLLASSLLLCRVGCFVSADDFSLFLAFHSQYKLSRLGQTHLSPVSIFESVWNTNPIPVLHRHQNRVWIQMQDQGFFPQVLVH